MRNTALTMLAGLVLCGGQALAQPTNLAPIQHNVVVGVTAVTPAVPANPSRKGLIVCNAGPAGSIIYLSFGTIMPAINTGYPLTGGAVVNSCLTLMPYMSPNVAMGAQINAIGSVAGLSLTALEF